MPRKRLELWSPSIRDTTTPKCRARALPANQRELRQRWGVSREPLSCGWLWFPDSYPSDCRRKKNFGKQTRWVCFYVFNNFWLCWPDPNPRGCHCVVNPLTQGYSLYPKTVLLPMPSVVNPLTRTQVTLGDACLSTKRILMKSSERIDEPRNRSLLFDDLDSGGNPSSWFRNGMFEGFYNLMFVVRVLISCFFFFFLF